MSVLTSLLVRDRVLPVSKVEQALERQVLEGGDIETILLEQGLVPEDTLAAFRAALFGLLPATREQVMSVPRDVLRLIPRDWAIRARIVPLERDGRMLVVAASEPLSDAGRREIESSLGDDLSLRIINPVRMEGALSQHYGIDASPRSLRLLELLRRREPGPVPYVRPPGPSLRPHLSPTAPDDDNTDLPELELPPPRGEPRTELAPRALAGLVPLPADARETVRVEIRPSGVPTVPRPLGGGPDPRVMRLSSVPPPSVGLSFAKALRGPLSEERVLELLGKAEQRDDVIYALLRYASQFFDFVGIFSVGKDGARGRMASSSRLPSELMEQVMLPISGQGPCARAIRDKRPLIADPTATDEERAAFALLGRSGGSAAAFLPIVLGTRPVLLVYADRDSEPVGAEDLEPIKKLIPAVVEALRRIILESKALRGSMMASPPSGPDPHVASSVETSAQQSSPQPAHSKVASPAPTLPIHEPTLIGTPPVVLPPSREPEVEVVDLDRLSLLYADRKRDPGRGSHMPSASPGAAPELKAAARQRLIGIPRTAPPPPEHESLPPDGRGSYSLTTAETSADSVRKRGSQADGPNTGETKLGLPVVGTPVAQIRPRTVGEPGAEPRPERGTDGASVIVDMGDQIAVLARGLLSAPAGEEPPQIAGLLAAGEAALPVLVQLFPGPLWFDRQKPHKRRPRGRDVSPVARALCAFGELATPYVASIIASDDAEQCYYGLLVAQEILHAKLLDVIAPRVFDGDDTLRSVALDSLRGYAGRPELSPLLHALGQVAERSGNDPRRQRNATEALAEVRDERALPLLLQRLSDPSDAIVQIAHRGLVQLTGQDFGLAQRKWEIWFEQWGRAHRVEWLIDSLLHQEESIRSLAGDELKQITQQYLGFHPQSPRRDRELVQRKYREWWESEGRLSFARPTP